MEILIHNYWDPDDDNDTVLTAEEDVNQNGDPRDDDTDGDLTPDYLDKDDDDDGILTRYEDTNQNGDLWDDDADMDGWPDYLDVDPVYTSTYQWVSLAGNMNNWEPAAAPMKRLDHHTWLLILPIAGWTNVLFRVVPDGNLPMAWGESNQTNFTLPLQGVAEAVGADIEITNVLAGLYQFTFQELSSAYTVEQVSVIDGD